MTVKHEITDRPVEDLSKPALVAEWSEICEQLASGTATVRDAAWDRRQTLWAEMRDRTDGVPPACPECGARSWSQIFGGAKSCNGCEFQPSAEDMDLIDAIDSYWSAVTAVGSSRSVVQDD
ncbi:hypothetical protein [Haloarcula sp. CBA1127]|uniref:hypothetical protein n=1 Tax=Haloarcula sp. CBA1127 TaxID=1765055 RepID=UPI00073E5DC0|nr:hypothetical protein [Haloarcula sp. CBA1127]